MLYSNSEEKIADDYFNHVNDVVGILALSLSGTALSFEHPEPFAGFFFIVLFMWIVSKGKDYKRISNRYLSRYKGVIGWLVVANKIKFYLIGMIALLLVALGEITKKNIYTLFGY